MQGALTKTAFMKYKIFQAQSNIYLKCVRHIFSVQKTKDFNAIIGSKKLIYISQNLIESNNQSIIFLGILGILLRGKTDDSALFNHLLHFSAESGGIYFWI